MTIIYIPLGSQSIPSRSNVDFSCGVAWRGPGRRSGPVAGRATASSFQLYPRQGRARSARQLQISVIWPLPSEMGAIHLNHLQVDDVSNSSDGGAAIPELRRTGPRLFSRSKQKEPPERACSETKEDGVTNIVLASIQLQHRFL